MRILSCILSLYVLMFSFISCPDQEGSVFEKEKTSTVTNPQEPCAEDNGLDPCSPFCTCQCCHTNSQVYNLRIAEYLPSQGEKQNSLYSNTFRFSLSSIIWQPPKA